MMTKEKQAKIKHFLEDKTMSDAVKEIIMQTFLEESEGSDVHTLAAERVAIKLLNKAYKNLETYRSIDKELKKSEINYL